MEWIVLDSPESIEELMREFAGFHDSCLREAHLATESFVASDRAMSCHSNLETSILLFLQSQTAQIEAIEVRCLEVSRFHLTPSGDGCDSIITSGAVGTSADSFRLALNFLGAPMKAAPNSFVWVPARSFETPDIDIIARRILWRPVRNGLGQVPRYRPRDLAPGHSS